MSGKRLIHLINPNPKTLLPTPPLMQMSSIISTIKVSGKRLLNLINDVLDAAKMKQGKLVIMHEVCACRSTVHTSGWGG